MKKNFVIILLFVLIGINFFGIYILEFPFYQEILIIATVAIIFLSLINENHVFFCAINIIIAYGLFLVIHAVVNKQIAMEVQMLYLFSHLLFTSIILMCWILLNYIKKMGEENNQLRLENTTLKKYKEGTQILTIQGFNEQAKWIIEDSKINNTETWMMKMKITDKHPRIKRQIQKTIEKTAQTLVRERYDLLASIDGRIYILLKDVSCDYVDKTVDAFFYKIKNDFNLIEPPVMIETKLLEENAPLVLKEKNK